MNQWLITRSMTLTIVLCYVFNISFISPLKAKEEEQDALIYSVYDYGEGVSLWRYDPQDKTASLIYQQEAHLRFKVNSLGIVAYSTPWNWNNNGEIYLLDTTSNQPEPTSLSQQMGLTGYPLGWSHDGRSLVFASWNDADHLLLYVWNGKTAINITPESGGQTIESFGDVAWSPDGRLTFTVWYSFSDEDGPPEIFLWDGNTVTTFSQNPTRGDHGAVWNSEGEVAFLSARDGARGVFVWDGQSFRNGFPDVESFINIAPELTYFMSPTWGPHGLLSFGATGPLDARQQIYAWDGSTITNLSQNAAFHNGGPQWSPDGMWAFTTLFSSPEVLYIRDTENRLLLTTEGQYTPAWGSTNELAFCQSDFTETSSNWVLSIWNETQLRELTRGSEIWAQWQSGQGTVCSSG